MIGVEKMKKHTMYIVMVFLGCFILIGCSDNGSTTDEDTDIEEETNTSNENNSDNATSENDATEESEEESEDDNFSHLLSDEHEPNVPDGPNVPDTPEGASPNVPDGPNIPDFPDVKMPNVDIDGDEEEITLQVPDTLLFEFDKSNLKSEAKQTLDELVIVLEEYDGADVQINGHTDDSGDADYNMTLSEERAESVRDYLDERGALDEINVKTEGYGKTKPITSNDTDEGQQKNRRVEIVIETQGE